VNNYFCDIEGERYHHMPCLKENLGLKKGKFNSNSIRKVNYLNNKEKRMEDCGGGGKRGGGQGLLYEGRKATGNGSSLKR